MVADGEPREPKDPIPFERGQQIAEQRNQRLELLRKKITEFEQIQGLLDQDIGEALAMRDVPRVKKLRLERERLTMMLARGDQLLSAPHPADQEITDYLATIWKE